MPGQIELDFGAAPIKPISAPSEDHKRLEGQNGAILARLKSGIATNVELASISLKYTARISDIRAAGYEIDARRVKGGLWEYRLAGE